MLPGVATLDGRPPGSGGTERVTSLVVVGGGVSGMTCALALARDGHAVEIRAREWATSTTSGVAAALWYPYAVEPAERVNEWALASYRVFAELAGDSASGVRMTDGLEVLEGDVEPPAWFAAVGGRVSGGDRDHGDRESERRGWSFRAPVVEMPRYLRWLAGALDQAGVRIVHQDVPSFDELFDAADLVVDCAGLGARDLTADDELYPARGHVVRVAADSIDRFVLDEHGADGVTYVVPRSEDVVLGGSFEPHEVDLEPDAAITTAIRARCERLVPALRGARVLSERVGLRPCRSGVRLELEETPAGPVVHDYGHGGAGVTLSWGCAHEVVRLVRARLES